MPFRRADSIRSSSSSDGGANEDENDDDDDDDDDKSDAAWRTRKARRVFMMLSPWPVVLAAPMASSAKAPAPSSGESPTRPAILHVMPPVLVAAAT